jgi:hypothetical protein
MTGKQKCKVLKSVRRKIADLNGIPYSPQECTHDGPCSGSCPLCDMEAKELLNALDKKEKSGEMIQIETQHLFELDQIAQWSTEESKEESYIPELCGCVMFPTKEGEISSSDIRDFELDIN